MHAAEPDKRPAPESQDGRRKHVEEQLDEALAESFPASDPVSITTSQEEDDWGAGDQAAEEPTPPPPPR
jgi:hypothetical protein